MEPELLQQLAALGAVALAAGWLTARWLIRRRRGACGGDCSRCTGNTAARPSCAHSSSGVRSSGLRVIQPGDEPSR